MTKLDAYELFENSYWEDDEKLIDYDFEGVREVLETFEIKLTKEQKEKIGGYLLDKYEGELEEYKYYLNKSAHESEVEDEVREHYYRTKGGE